MQLHDRTEQTFQMFKRSFSLRTKIIVITIISLLIAAPISSYLNAIIHGAFPNTQLGVYVDTIVNLCVTTALITIFVHFVTIRPLNKVVAALKSVSEGDLTVKVNTRSGDEIGRLGHALNETVARLNHLIEAMLAAARNVSNVSQQISAATDQIATGSMSQAESSETVNQLFKELSIAINAVAVNAEQAAELSSHGAEVAKQGDSIVQASVQGMSLVNEQIARLTEDSNRVGEIIEVIDDIAEQTNLLALNAAIEAARAGEQGRGFAVVADEVRKLAERSVEATKQITTIIKTIQANTMASVNAVNEGVSSTQKSGAAFQDIASMVNKTADKVGEIAAASEQQAAQASEVLAAVESIASAAEQSAASSQETAASSQSLTELANQLNEFVHAFKVS